MQISRQIICVAIILINLSCASAPKMGYIKEKSIRESDPSQSCLVAGHIEATMFWGLVQVAIKSGERTITNSQEDATVFLLANIPKGSVSLAGFSGIIPGNNYVPSRGYVVANQKVWQEQRSPDTNVFHLMSDIVHDSANKWQPLSGYEMNDVKAECTGGFLWLGEYKFIIQGSNYSLERISKPEKRLATVNTLREKLIGTAWATVIK